MLLTVALALEYEAICTLAEHRLASGLSAAGSGNLCEWPDWDGGAGQGVLSMASATPRSGDELILEAAVNGQADAIVTFNVSHLRDAHKNFGIEVIRPGEALRRIEK